MVLGLENEGFLSGPTLSLDLVSSMIWPQEGFLTLP